MWEGTIDDSESFFSHSLCYKILKKANPSYHKDYERNHRLRIAREDPMHHKFTMRVYLKSMSFRYYLEVTFFLGVMIPFMVFILRWITSMQSFADVAERWSELMGKKMQGIITAEESTEFDLMSNSSSSKKTIEVAVQGLVNGFFCLWCSIFFLLQDFNAWFSCYLSHKKFVFSPKHMIDLILFGFAVWSFVLFTMWTQNSNEIPPGLGYPETYGYKFTFTANARQQRISGDFRFTVFLGLIIITFWARLVATVMNTNLVGPTLRILGAMTG